mgnify:CR=1 FL=1
MHFIWHHLAPVSDSRLKKNRSRPKKNRPCPGKYGTGTPVADDKELAPLKEQTAKSSFVHLFFCPKYTAKSSFTNSASFSYHWHIGTFPHWHIIFTAPPNAPQCKRPFWV